MKRKRKADTDEDEDEEEEESSSHKNKIKRGGGKGRKRKTINLGSSSEDEKEPGAVEGGESDVELQNDTEIIKEDGSITSQCVLEFDKVTTKPIIEVDRTLIRKLKPHQVEAVRFVYRSCIVSLERMRKGEESGCILAHYMGLGKTLSVISFLHAMLKSFKETKMSKCLVVCPLNTVLNWVNEFDIWLDDVDFKIKVYEMSEVKQVSERTQILEKWHKGEAGVMILNYDLYRSLLKSSHYKKHNIFFETLADPGPDIVVCDEGHILKHDMTLVSKALMKIKSHKRIVLTGTPLQNNLKEYYCIVNFVRPSFLGTRKEFANLFENPITNGQDKDSTLLAASKMKKRAYILHDLLDKIVQRKDYSVLSKCLPPKFEYVISVRLTQNQIVLYKKYLEQSGQGSVGDSKKRASVFRAYQYMMRIWNDSLVLNLDEKKLNDESEGEDSFNNDSTTSSAGGGASVSRKTTMGGGMSGSSSSEEDTKYGETIDSYNEVVKKLTSRRKGNESPKEVSSDSEEFAMDEDEVDLQLSGKLMLLFQIVKMSEDIGDKVLVFSPNLSSLNIIEDLLHTGGEGNKKSKLSLSGKSWTKGTDYFRMDGSVSAQERKAAQDRFNDPKNKRARVFLISTKAGSLGINLVSANRVILFDASWNPSLDTQSIFRAYRLGQKKPVFVYRLVAQGTMEEKIYKRQVTKQSLSGRVVDEQQIERHYSADELKGLTTYTAERLDQPDIMESQPKDRILAELISNHKKWIVTYHEHDTLLKHIVEQELTVDEKQAAWLEYENEKGLASPTSTPQMELQI